KPYYDKYQEDYDSDLQGDGILLQSKTLKSHYTDRQTLENHDFQVVPNKPQNLEKIAAVLVHPIDPFGLHMSYHSPQAVSAQDVSKAETDVQQTILAQ